MIQNPIKQDISFRIDDSSGIQVQVVITVTDELEYSIVDMAFLARNLQSDVQWSLNKLKESKAEEKKEEADDIL